MERQGLGIGAVCVAAIRISSRTVPRTCRPKAPGGNLHQLTSFIAELSWAQDYTGRRKCQNSVSPQKLKRSLTLWLAVLYGLGVTIGAGIYVLVGIAAGRSGMHAPLAFVLAALVMSFSAASFAELGTRMPVSASEAAYVEKAFNRPWLSLTMGLLVVSDSDNLGGHDQRRQRGLSWRFCRSASALDRHAGRALDGARGLSRRPANPSPLRAS